MIGSFRRFVTRFIALRLLAPLFRVTHTRIYQANLHRIGDTLIDVGFYVKARQLGWYGSERALVLPPPRNRRPANIALLPYLAPHVRIIRSRWLYPFLFPCLSQPGVGGLLWDGLHLPDGRRIDQYLYAMVVQDEWESSGRPPLFALSKSDREQGRQALETLGVGDDWFVCLHVREAGFLREAPTSPHRHLNADVTTYLPAVEWIIEQGGWVIRMGDPSMRRLPPRDRVIDYAHHAAKSPLMDVLLAAQSRFWLGTNSGLFMLASSFGVPAALTNVAPATFRPWASTDMFIPKLYWSPAQGRLLTFGESIDANLYTHHAIDAQRVIPVDNEPEDILALTVEMLDRLEGQTAYSRSELALHQRFAALQPGYYPVPMLARVGTAFLRKHEKLLSDAPPTESGAPAGEQGIGTAS